MSSPQHTASLKVTAKVTNAGAMDGDEIVQLYVGFENSAVDRQWKLESMDYTIYVGSNEDLVTTTLTI